MEVANLFIRIIEAIIWPVTVLIIILIFRQQFKRALLTLSKLRIKDIEVEFDKNLKDAENKAEELQIVYPEEIRKIPEPLELTSLYERLLEITKISPRAAITEAWRTIELYTMQAANAQGITVGGAIAGKKTIRKLIDKGKLEEGVIHLYENLRSMRNKAAHAQEFEIDSAEAARYVDIALSITNLLRKLGNS